MTDVDLDSSDLPETDEEFWKGAKVVLPVPKKLLSIRLDEDVVQWCPAPGKGYQSRINAGLRADKEAHR